MELHTPKGRVSAVPGHMPCYCTISSRGDYKYTGERIRLCEYARGEISSRSGSRSTTHRAATSTPVALHPRSLHDLNRSAPALLVRSQDHPGQFITAVVCAVMIRRGPLQRTAIKCHLAPHSAGRLSLLTAPDRVSDTHNGPLATKRAHTPT